jgi:hypothetical protein
MTDVTLLLSRSDLAQLLEIGACTAALEQGFRAGSSPFTPQRVRTDLPGPGTATALIPGLVDGVPAYTVKSTPSSQGRGQHCVASSASMTSVLVSCSR